MEGEGGFPLPSAFFYVFDRPRLCILATSTHVCASTRSSVFIYVPTSSHPRPRIQVLKCVHPRPQIRASTRSSVCIHAPKSAQPRPHIRTSTRSSPRINAPTSAHPRPQVRASTRSHIPGVSASLCPKGRWGMSIAAKIQLFSAFERKKQEIAANVHLYFDEPADLRELDKINAQSHLFLSACRASRK